MKTTIGRVCGRILTWRFLGGALVVCILLLLAFWLGVRSEPLVEKVIVKLTPPEPTQALPMKHPPPVVFPEDGVVVRAADVRATINPFEVLPDGVARLPEYIGLTEWLTFDQAVPRELVLVARGKPSQHGYPLVQVLLESSEGETLFDKRFKVFADNWEAHHVKLPALQGDVTLRVFFLRGVFEGRGDVLDIQQFYVSDARLAESSPNPPTLKQRTDALIRKHRMGTLRVQAEPGAAVAIRQTRHAFQFGSSIGSVVFKDGRLSPENLKRYQETFLANFNAATPAVLYWQSTERSRNKSDFEVADKAIQWCHDNGLYVRGHTVFWGSDVRGRVMDWQKRLENEDLRHVIRRRGKQVTARYKGLVDEYDFNNEMVHHKYFRTRMFDIAYDMAVSMKAGDPDATLYFNDFNVLTLGALNDYTDLLDRLLADGVPVEGLGVQGHADGEIYYKHAWEALDRLEGYDMPVKITEAGPATWVQAARAEALEKLFRTCFAHPAVDGITIWDFWQPIMWQQKAALWDEDWNILPAGEAYVRLVKDEWWTTWDGRADENGMVEIPAFYGAYEVTIEGKDTVNIRLSKPDGASTAKAETVGSSVTP